MLEIICTAELEDVDAGALFGDIDERHYFPSLPVY